MEQDEEQKEERKDYSFGRFFAFGCLGYFSGFLVKKMGKYLLIFAGGTIIVLELTSDRGYLDRFYRSAIRSGNIVLRTSIAVIGSWIASYQLRFYDYAGLFGGFASALLF